MTSDTAQKKHLRISHDLIDDMLATLGPADLGLYIYLGRLARWADAPSTLGEQAINQGELVRTERTLAEACATTKSSIHRALNRFKDLGLISTRKLGDSQIITLRNYLVHFGAFSEPEANHKRTRAEPEPNQSRTASEPINNNNNNSSSNSIKNTSKRGSRKTLTLLPYSAYKDLIIPDWKIKPANPINISKHELAPPNAVVGVEAPLPIPLGDMWVPKPGTVIPAEEVYKAIFWVFPREWDAYTDRGGGFPEDPDEWIRLEAWAVANREKFHTDKRYGNHTAWCKARLGSRANGNYGSRTSYN